MLLGTLLCGHRLGRCCWLCLRCLVGAKAKSVHAAEQAITTGAITDKSLVQSFEQPVGLFLCNRAVCHCLLDASAKLCLTFLLDGRLDVGVIDAFLLSDL